MDMNLQAKMPKNDREWRATTGYDKARFEKLIEIFEIGYRSKFGKSIEEVHSESLKEVCFKTYSELLFYTLFGLKSGVTFDVLGFIFGIDVSNAHRNLTLGIKVLELGLAFSGHLPKREFKTPEEFAEYFKGQKTLILDVTEQRVQRPKDNDFQKKLYSGKKKSYH
jgi:Helix-turn-helix of DDE superfamily endonuclease